MVPANELENKMNRRQRVNDRAYLEPNNITDLCFDVLGEMSVLNASRKRQQVYILAKTRVVVPSDGDNEVFCCSQSSELFRSCHQ